MVVGNGAQPAGRGALGGRGGVELGVAVADLARTGWRVGAACRLRGTPDMYTFQAGLAQRLQVALK